MNLARHIVKTPRMKNKKTTNKKFSNAKIPSNSLITVSLIQGCGSASIFSGPGSRGFSECGSGSGSSCLKNADPDPPQKTKTLRRVFLV